MYSLLELFCHVDDFCKAFLPHWNKQLLSARRPRGRRPGLCMSEIMTILIHFHQSNYRNFKAYYLEYVMTHLRNEFPGLVSYNRFVELIPSVIVPLTHYLRHACLGKPSSARSAARARATSDFVKPSCPTGTNNYFQPVARADDASALARL